MLSIAGGCYSEFCSEPLWDQFYGPGGRAAVALSERSIPIHLHAYASDADQNALNALTQPFGIKAHTTSRPYPVKFRYLHMLRVPTITPERDRLSPLPQLELEGDVILRYGFYEGDAKVHGKRVVYDPQNGRYSAHFHANGSTAEKLAIVCNYGEGRHLANSSSVQTILDNLLSINGVEAVILKGAWKGAWVATKEQRKIIPPRPTSYIHKIGSGDVFAAEFAYGWGVLGEDAIFAADRASIQTSYYCDTTALPLPEHAKAPPFQFPKIPPLDGTNKKYDIYLAGPFFSAGQLAVIEELLENLKSAELSVFSPYHDVGVGHAEDICKADLDGLVASRLMLAVLDGLDPGTLFEIGYARALEIPVLIYWRNVEGLHKTMLCGSGCEIVTDYATAVYKACWWALPR